MKQNLNNELGYNDFSKSTFETSTLAKHLLFPLFITMTLTKHQMFQKYLSWLNTNFVNNNIDKTPFFILGSQPILETLSLQKHTNLLCQSFTSPEAVFLVMCDPHMNKL
jgi:hypothetical protein